VKKAFTIVRVSDEDQLRGYGPDSQWCDDVVPNAPLLGLDVSEKLRRVIQESATGWDRDKFETAVREALELYRQGEVQALLFPRVDRETRFLFGSFPLLCEVIRAGMEVHFGRERFQLDVNDNESVSRYLRKVEEAQAYAETVRLNTMRGRRRRAERDHKMPNGGRKWAFDYDPASGRYVRNEGKAYWLRKCAEWLLEEGCSLKECCRRHGSSKLTHSGLLGILKDPGLIGKFYAYRSKIVRGADGRKKRIPMPPGEWILVYEDPSQAILSPEQFYAIQDRLRWNRENSPRHAKHWYPPLRGLVICSVCGRRMSGHTPRDVPYYVCPICTRRVNARQLWQSLKEGIRARLLEPERLVPGIKAQLRSGKSLQRLEEDQRNLQRQKEGWEQSKVKARRLHLLPDSKYSLDDYLADSRSIDEQLDRVNRELSEVEQDIAQLRQAIVDEEGIIRFCERVAHNLDSMDDSRWRVLLERMRLRVVVERSGQLVVHLALATVEEPTREIALSTSGAG